VPTETADQTDGLPDGERAESEEGEHDMEVEPTTTSTLGERTQSLEEMLNFIKAEHQECSNRNEYILGCKQSAESDSGTFGGDPKQCPHEFHVWTVQSTHCGGILRFGRQSCRSEQMEQCRQIHCHLKCL